MLYPVLISQIAIDPSLAPETISELYHSNSITASLCPLNNPYRHSNVFKFQTSNEESYADVTAILY